jgi:hypothetical protein
LDVGFEKLFVSLSHCRHLSRVLIPLSVNQKRKVVGVSSREKSGGS